LEDWLEEVGTDETLGYCIVEYARRRRGMSMAKICWGKEEQYRRMAIDQDDIGWRRFMEGMISKRMRGIQELYHKIEGSLISPENWTTGLVIKLLEITHGQWLYQCVQVQDGLTGTKATQQKEELKQEIERQQEMGAENLREEDQYLCEIDLRDLKSSSREKQHYWLLAIQAAREAYTLQGSQWPTPRAHPP
jgi:hypothetical protein